MGVDAISNTVHPRPRVVASDLRLCDCEGDRSPAPARVVPHGALRSLGATASSCSCSASGSFRPLRSAPWRRHRQGRRPVNLSRLVSACTIDADDASARAIVVREPVRGQGRVPGADGARSEARPLPAIPPRHARQPDEATTGGSRRVPGRHRPSSEITRRTKPPATVKEDPLEWLDLLSSTGNIKAVVRPSE